MRRVPKRPCGLGLLSFIAGIFTALILPMWLIAVVEGALIIILGCTLLRM